MATIRTMKPVTGCVLLCFAIVELLYQVNAVRTYFNCQVSTIIITIIIIII